MEVNNNISVLYLNKIDTLVIKKSPESGFFITSDDSIIISRQALLILLKFLVGHGIIHPKNIESLLEEIPTI